MGSRSSQTPALQFCAASDVVSSAATLCATLGHTGLSDHPEPSCTATCPTTAASRPDSVRPHEVRLSLQLSPSRVHDRQSAQGPCCIGPSPSFLESTVTATPRTCARARLVWLAWSTRPCRASTLLSKAPAPARYAVFVLTNLSGAYHMRYDMYRPCSLPSATRYSLELPMPVQIPRGRAHCRCPMEQGGRHPYHSPVAFMLLARFPCVRAADGRRGSLPANSSVRPIPQSAIGAESLVARCPPGLIG